MLLIFKALYSFLMEADILVNYWMAVQKDKEQFYMVMGQSMKVIGKMVMLMDLEY